MKAMVNVCILVRVMPGKVAQVLGAIKALEDVRKAYDVFGRYDIVVFARPADHKAAARLSHKVHGISGVKSTETLVEG